MQSPEKQAGLVCPAEHGAQAGRAVAPCPCCLSGSPARGRAVGCLVSHSRGLAAGRQSFTAWALLSVRQSHAGPHRLVRFLFLACTGLTRTLAPWVRPLPDPTVTLACAGVAASCQGMLDS